MTFDFRCPSCQTKYSVSENVIGRQVRCANCGDAIVVSGPGGVDPSTQEPTPPPTQAAAAPLPEKPDDDDEPLDFGEKRKDIEADMDMTPMVDVTFLLLIFFMVTAAFSMQKSLEIPKPNQDEASTQSVPKEPEDDPSYVTVWVDENNTYRVVTTEWDEEAPSEQELLRKLRQARNGDSAGNTPTKLLVKAHGDSLHEKVVSALDAGTEVGMEQVQLMKVEEID
ncbi:MAG: biopolymer transporter ExbD [Planctomycetes bacterium]|nr:biopolymer transporter ExbD [Planctomycetota bacterium]MBL7042913.1 biopolymer transporter ExbD [Pirellulaceae bacterium]